MVADGEGDQERGGPRAECRHRPLPIDGVPEALFAPEAFAAAPSAAGLTDLLDVLGGMDGLELGNIEGAYDIVTIDPDDTDRVLLSKRDDYIRGESNGMNQDENILWETRVRPRRSACARA